MSAPTSVSVGVSSFSFNQDLLKLRHCLANIETYSSEDGSYSRDTSENRLYVSEENHEDQDLKPLLSVDKPQSELATVRSLDNCSVSTAGTSSQSNHEGYLRDHSVEVALVTNEMYQEALKEAIARLEMVLVQNLEKQNAVKYELDHREEKKDPSGNSPKFNFKCWQVLCAPYLKDSDGFPFPENADAKDRRLRNETSPYVKETQKWTKHEQALLNSACKSDLRKKILQPILQKKEIICSKLKNKDVSPEVINNLESKLRDLNNEQESKLKLSDYEILCQCSQGIDWMQISTMQFDGARSADSCEIMWRNRVQPSIYKGSWTKEEDAKLEQIARNYNLRDWDSIAKELGSKRTAEQCIKRYHGHLNVGMVAKGYWSVEESNTLLELVEELRVGDKIPWGKISSFLECRHPNAVRRHWERSLNQDIKRGPWKLEEDIVLLTGVQKYGLDYNNLSRLLPGRTYMQCRVRYQVSLNLDINFEKWTKEDDRKLIKIVKEKGIKWAELAHLLPGRTSSMIRQRYSVILKRIPDAYDRVQHAISEWPCIPSHSNSNPLRRRMEIYYHMVTRNRALNILSPGCLPKQRHSVKLIRDLSKAPVEVAPLANGELGRKLLFELKNCKHLDFILDEARQMLKKPVRVRKLKKVVTACPLDNALDSLLLPSVACKKSGRKKCLALSGKDSLEFELCKTSFLKALNIPSEKDDDVNAVALSKTSENETTTKVNKLEVRSDFYSHGIQQTILKQCIGNVSSSQMYSVLPPSKPTVNAFKLMVMDRKRVIEFASLVEDVTVIQRIAETPASEKPTCFAHTGFKVDCVQTSPKETGSADVTESTGTNLTKNPNFVDSECPRRPASINCSECTQLARLHASYHKFKNRFISLFFWPAQMFLVPPPEESIDPSPEHFCQPTVKRLGRKRRRHTTSRGVNAANESPIDGNTTKKQRKSRENKYKNMSSVRTSARQAKKLAG